MDQRKFLLFQSVNLTVSNNQFRVTVHNHNKQIKCQTNVYTLETQVSLMSCTSETVKILSYR